MLRSTLTTLCAGLAALALGAPISGQELMVGGPDSLIRRSNPAQGPFTLVGACGGIVDSMTTLGDTTYIGDVNGRIYVHRPSTGIGYAFDAASDATALAIHNGNLLVARTNGTLLRYNVATGALISALPANMPIHAMLRVGNHLFVGSHFGIVRRADLSTGGPFLTLVVTDAPPSTFGICYMGIGSGTSTIGDGIFCTGGTGGYGNYRYPVAQVSPGGTFTMSGFAAHANHHFDLLGSIQAGRSWHFQIWYRDQAGPCGHAFNTSNGYQVTFTL